MLTYYDKILITSTVILSVISLIIIRYYYTGKADEVLVQVNGKEVIRAKLDTDSIFSVDGVIGKSEIEIKDRRVRMVSSPCDKKICIQSCWINQPYETIVCIPNRIAISLVSNNDKDIIDGLTR